MIDESSAEARAALKGEQNRGAKAQRCRDAKAQTCRGAKAKTARVSCRRRKKKTLAGTLVISAPI